MQIDKGPIQPGQGYLPVVTTINPIIKVGHTLIWRGINS